MGEGGGGGKWSRAREEEEEAEKYRTYLFTERKEIESREGATRDFQLFRDSSLSLSLWLDGQVGRPFF